VQLGHRELGDCKFSIPVGQKFAVIASNGIHHDVHMSYCGCRPELSKVEQLIEFGLWPATGTSPETVVTLQTLCLCQFLNLAGRLPPTDFYETLVWLTDGERLTVLPVSLSSLHTISRDIFPGP
jgi:hypothetical protein